LPSCCVSFLSNSAFTQLLLTFLPPLLLCPPLLDLWEVVLAAAGQARPSSMTQVPGLTV